MSIIKVVTVWQPWASLIAIGAKPYEFRGWAAPVAVRGQRIGIHAGARKVKLQEIWDLIGALQSDKAWETCLRPDLALPLLSRAFVEPDILPRSAILCTAMLGEPLNAMDIVHEFGGPVNDSSRNEHSNFAWPLADIEPLLPPVEATGMQGFWNYGGAL